MTFNFIMAVDTEWGIAKDGNIPWKSKEDLIFFKEQTVNNIILMGYNTWQSLPKKPLPNRLHLVIGRNIEETVKNTVFFDSLQECVNFMNSNSVPEKYQDKPVYFIGGSKLLKELINQELSFDTIYLSKFHHDYGCDTDIKFFEKELENYKIKKIKYCDDFDIYEYKYNS